MENRNDNLGNFFRKKLSEFDRSDHSLNRPDENIRTELLEKITEPEKPAAFPKNTFWKIAFIIALLLIGGYIYHLKKENLDIKKGLHAQAEQLEKVKSELEKTIFENEKNTSILIEENKKLAAERGDLISQNNELSILLKKENATALKHSFENKKHEKEIEKLTDRITQMEHEPEIREDFFEKENDGKYEKLTALAIVQKIAPIVLRQYLEKERTVAEENTQTEPIEKPQLDISKTIEPIKPKNKRYELGYEYALMGYDIPIERRFDRQRSVADNVQGNMVNVHSHGFFFSFSPRKNWWFRTGIRTAAVNLRRHLVMGLEYDRANETTRPGEPTSNQLMLTTATPFTETRSAFDVSFDAGQELEQGDLLNISVHDFQSLRFFQIPFGMEYFYGSEKIKWFAQSGLQYNRINFGDYNFFILSEADGERVAVRRGRVISQNIPVRQFMSIYGGLGLDCHIFKNIHARASFNLNYNFIKNNDRTTDFSNPSKTGTAFRLGLNYRF